MIPKNLNEKNRIKLIMMLAKDVYPDRKFIFGISPPLEQNSNVHNALIASSMGKEETSDFVVRLFKGFAKNNPYIDVDVKSSKKEESTNPVKKKIKVNIDDANIFSDKGMNLDDEDVVDWKNAIIDVVKYATEKTNGGKLIFIANGDKINKSAIASTVGSAPQTFDMMISALRTLLEQGLEDFIGEEMIMQKVKDIIKDHKSK